MTTTEPLVLTMLDTTGIQAYIFGSNRLRENTGASHLVESATNAWVKDALPNHSLKPVYCGGGNALLRVPSLEQARAVVTELSRRLLHEAPGLNIAVAHQEVAPGHAIGGTDGAYQHLLERLAHAKQQRAAPTPLLGVAVTLACASTGLPAVGYNEDNPISADVAAKVRSTVQGAADRRLQELLKIPPGYELSRDMDHLGRSEGERSYVAVVYADGNAMGQRFKSLIEAYPNAADNETLLDKLGALSQAVSDAATEALRRTVARLARSLAHPPPSWSDAYDDLHQSLWKREQKAQKQPYFPFRPLVYGGDDVTFVCDGRIGLAMAAAYLEEFEHAAASLPHGGPATASAGVAIVKTHYPFARAYALAEELCKEAKRWRRQEKHDGSTLDWHIATSGLSGSIGDIRGREYTVADGSLSMRPARLHHGNEKGDAPAWRSWEDLARLIDTFVTGDQWRDRRNKIKALREALRGGKDTTERFRTMYDLSELPELDRTVSDLQESGWKDGVCGYFDAIEAMDFYLPLLPREETSSEKGAPAQ